ncbi:MAG TPA: tetratricopeptide repeat protein [Candidatus Moranbacteria bacterium]|nr:tetratricopeptide repeat protein [Candidatus Moranbacteria bacterium]
MKKAIVLLAVLIVFGLIVFIGFKFYQKGKPDASTIRSEVNYVIEGVPYNGLHNHKEKAAFISNDLSAAVFSILEYWNPEKNDVVLVDYYLKAQSGRMITPDRINDFFGFYKSKDDYEKPQVIDLDINEFKKYVNQEKKIPLILMMPLSGEQTEEIPFNPVWVLIGIKDAERKLVLHNYWQGNNYEISFDDFNKIKEIGQKTGGSACVLVQPKNLSEKIKEINKRNIAPYKPRTSVMDKGREMYDNYAIGRAFFFSGFLPQKSLDYLFKVKNDPNFEEFLPPVFKIRTYNTIAMILNGQKKTDDALRYANLAAELNHDVDKPFKDYPGFDAMGNGSGQIGLLGEVYTTLGDIYKEKNDLAKARENYQKSLDIKPNNNLGASTGLQLLEVTSTINNLPAKQ